jgi:hypothetical protein
MDAKRQEFLTTMVAILGRLSETSASKGEPLLASMLSIARKEAEDALGHADVLRRLEADRAAHSATNSWRACDQQAGSGEARAAELAA